MEQLDKLLNNINNSHLAFFMSGFFVPVILYFLASTSFEKILRKITFWRWSKVGMYLGAIGLIMIVIIIFLSTITFENDESEAHSVHSGKLTNPMHNMPGMDGDQNKRYTVSFLHPETIEPNKDVELVFKVNDADTGHQTKLFKVLYEKLSHVIIVDSELTFFKHIHTDKEENGFIMTTQFPKDGIYHVYIDFQPWGATEQQFGFVVQVGNNDKPVFSNATPDTSESKVFGDYKVQFKSPELDAEEMSEAQQKITYTLTNAKTGEPLTTLQPYLQTFGHLVMINQETFEYLHIHPDRRTPVMSGELGGPDVSFLPMAITRSFKPGIYRAFAEFNPDGKLFTADFTVEIK